MSETNDDSDSLWSDASDNETQTTTRRQNKKQKTRRTWINIDFGLGGLGPKTTQQVIEDFTQLSTSRSNLSPTPTTQLQNSAELIEKIAHTAKEKEFGSPILNFGRNPGNCPNSPSSRNIEMQSPVIGEKSSPVLVKRKLTLSDLCMKLGEFKAFQEEINIEEVSTQAQQQVHSLSDEAQQLRELRIDQAQISIEDNDVPPPPTQASTLTPTPASQMESFRISTFTSNSKGKKSKKFTFKKSGFAATAMKALKVQNSQTAIWKHENAMSTLNVRHDDDDDDDKGCQGNNSDGNEIRNLIVNDETFEFNRCILVCESCSNKNRCLLLLSNVDVVEFGGMENTFKGKRIRLFPPYSRKFIDYHGSFVSFYYNVCRLRWG